MMLGESPWYFMLTILLFLFPLNARTWELAELGDLTLEHKKFDNAETPYVLGYKAGTETNLKMDMVFLGSFFWRNTVHSQTDESQYRLVGWNWEIGVKPFSWLEISRWHFSRHTLDSQNPTWTGGWKEDGWVFRFFLYQGAKPNAIW